MARENKSQYALLGCLSIKPMSAYQMKNFIARSVGHFWSEGEGQIYPSLRALLGLEYVICEEMEAEKGGIKKVYSITDAGREALCTWLCLKPAKAVYRNELLLKLFFGSTVAVDNNIELLHYAKNDLMESLGTLKMIKNNLVEMDIPTPRIPYITMTLNYGIKMTEAELSWCEESLQQLKAMQ